MGAVGVRKSAAKGARPVDGRNLRSERTRNAIVEASHGLLLAGELRPTAAAIAEKAGLSVRSVFQHFADLEDLFLAVADLQMSKIAHLYEAAAYEGEAFETRLVLWADRRQRLHETSAPIRRASILHERQSSVVRQRLDLARLVNRHDVCVAFAPELQGVDPASYGKDWRLDSIAAIGSFRHWDVLRTASNLSPDAAKAVLVSTVRAVLSAA